LLRATIVAGVGSWELGIVHLNIIKLVIKEIQLHLLFVTNIEKDFGLEVKHGRIK
jgi:hypothetical protein